MKIILISLLVLGNCLTLNKLDNDIHLNTGRGTFHKMNLNSLTVIFGLSSKKNKLQTNLEIEFGNSQTIIGNLHLTGWGISCGSEKEDEATTCQFDEVIIINYNLHFIFFL